MDCAQAQNQLDDYLDGALDSGAIEDFERHWETCSECRSSLDRARRVLDGLRRLPVEGPEDGFAERALAAAARPKRRRFRTASLGAAGFVAAFAASVLTVIYTGLLVDAPQTEISAGLPTVSMSVDEPRTVNLVFASSSDIDDVSLLIDLPEGVELSGYPGRRQVRWRTQLDQGKNVLPLELVAHDEARGQLVARLQHGDREKIFRVYLTVMPG